MPSLSKMPSPAEALIKVIGAGRPQSLPGNQPLALDGGAAAYLVTDGRINIFAQSPADGGRRHFLCPVTAGEMFFSSDAQADPTLIAVAQDKVELQRYPVTELSAALQAGPPELITRIENWLMGLTGAIAGPSLPNGRHQVPESDSAPLKLAAGSQLFSPDVFVWLKTDQPGLCLLADPELGLVAGKWLPLTPNLWLSTDQDLELEVRTTKSLVVSGAENLAGLLAAARLFFSSAWQKILAREMAAAAEHLASQEEREKRGLRGALQALSGVLVRRRDDPLAAIAGLPPLLGAVCLVAGAGGIEIRDPAGQKEIADVNQIARKNHFSTRTVQLEDGWWKKDNGPLLGRLAADGAPVALLPASARGYWLIDPRNRSKRKLGALRARELQAEAVVFNPPFPARELTFPDLIRFSFKSIASDLLLMLGAGCAGAVIGLLVPIMAGYVVDSVIPHSARLQLEQITLFLLAAVLAKGLFDVSRAIALVRIEGRLDASLQAGMVERLFSLPIQFFSKFSAGDLANRGLGINSIRHILSGVILSSLMTCVFSIFNLALLFWYSWVLALVALAVTLAAIALTALFGKWMVQHQRPIFRYQGMLSGLTLQLISGIVKIRVAGRENHAFAQWSKLFAEKMARSYKVGKINAGLQTVIAIFPVIGMILVFWFYLNFCFPEMTVGDFLTFFIAFNMFLFSFIEMAVVSSNVLYIKPLMERAQPILATVPEADDSKKRVGELQGLVEAQQLNYRYASNGPLILQDVSLQAEPGEFVAIVGGSGSGKSTLLKLLLGFDFPESGGVYYDHQDLSKLDVRDVRQRLGVVLQNAKIMPGDIFENIVGVSNLSVGDAWEAARMVGMADDIKAMPMGMNTYLAAGSGVLSGGQVQRLLVARALVHRPKILYLDEATSALDNRTQQIVSQSIEQLNVTRIVIAHRLSTIIKADRIYVLEKGKISESGNYETLMQNRGFFYELAKRQLL